MAQGDQTPNRPLDQARTSAVVLPTALRKQPQLLTASAQKTTGNRQLFH